MKQELVNQLEAAHLIDKPLSTVLVLIDVRLKQVKDRGKHQLVLSSLTYGQVAGCSKFEDSQFELIDQFRVLNGNWNVQRIGDGDVLLILLRAVKAVKLEVVILGEVVFSHDVAGVPIETDVLDELMVLGAKEEPVLPIFLVLIGDLLLNLTV